MASQLSDPAAADGLDVSLEDTELKDELGLLAELMVALNGFDNRLSSGEVDTVLGL